MDGDLIAPAEFPPGSACDDPEGLGVPPLLTDEFSGVIGMCVDGEGGTVFCYLRLDDNELRLVNQFSDNLEYQLMDRNISWVGQRKYSSGRILAQKRLSTLISLARTGYWVRLSA